MNRIYNYFTECIQNCFTFLSKKKNNEKSNSQNKIFNNDEGDLLYYSCFEEDINNKKN